MDISGADVYAQTWGGRCEFAKLKHNTEWLENCTAIDSGLSRPEQDTHLMGEDSLEGLEASWGLEGAENIGHEGERGEVGLGEAGLWQTHTHTPAPTFTL